MTAFRFRLERALEWRRTELAREQAKLEGFLTELGALSAAAESVRERRADAHSAVAGASAVRGSELAALELIRVWALAEEARLARRAAAVRQNIAEQKSVVGSARSRVRLLERLRQRRYEEWKYEAARELEMLAAEAALGQWRRRAES